MSFRHLVHIEQNFFFGVQTSFFPAIFVVLFAIFGAAVIIVAIFKNRNALIFFLNSGFHLSKQIGLKSFCSAHYFLQIIIFGCQIVHHLGAVWSFAKIVVHPIIIIQNLIAVNITPMLLFIGNRGCSFLKLCI